MNRIRGPARPAYRRRPISWLRSAGLALLATAASSCSDQEWRFYGGDAANRRYSDLAQIDRSNVDRLEVAWVYRTGEQEADGSGQIQCNPIVVEAVLYCTSAGVKAFALRADTGEELWSFDPFASGEEEGRRHHVSRGVAYWEDGADRRIFFGAEAHIYALDAVTGEPIPTFGRGGTIDLREGLGRELAEAYVVATTPGIVYGDLLIQGTRVSEGEGGAPGHIRAYDVRTGEIRWTFHTIPQPGEYGYESWSPDAWKTAGGANSWAGMSLDQERGIVYIPTGSASFDFYGGDRIGDNLFANSVLALDAATGERVWHFQTVHHDLWDRDLPAPPNLVTVEHDGRRVDALAQVTKSAFVFLLDRETGEPLFPVEERPVPPSDLRGERASPTQPFPARPAPFARQEFTEADITDISPESHAYVLERFRRLRSAGQFVPPGTQGTIIFPGFDGGAEWGGAAFDPATGILYVNASEMPWIAAMLEKPDPAVVGSRSGAEVYAAACSSCHGSDREGDGDRVPSLLELSNRLTAGEVRDIVQHGRGFMPGLPDLPAQEREAVVGYVLGRPSSTPTHDADPAGTPEQPRVPYRFGGYHRFLDPHGYPAVKPPWGTLNAIDLNTGEIVWQVPLGEFPELTARGIPLTGTENYGGPVVTAGGLVFIGATRDERFRAFDKRTGERLWETQLPAGGYATPSTYEVDGKQYVVIAAGGGKMGTRSGDSFVAFALPAQ